jgi:diacylglycerol kinase (ATP)
MIVANPQSTRFGGSLAKTLERSSLDVRYTRRRGDGGLLARDAREAGYQAVLAIGGDGTVNEIANALVGSSVRMACIPTGMTNVCARLLGWSDGFGVSDLGARAPTMTEMIVMLPRLNDRHFVASAGMGASASVVRRLDTVRARPVARRLSYVGQGVRTLAGSDSGNHLTAFVAGRSTQGETALIQNGAAYTYLGRRAIRFAESSAVDQRGMAIAVLRRSSALQVARLVTKIALGHCAAESPALSISEGALQARVDGGGTEFDAEVDGEYIGTMTVAEIRCDPESILHVIIPT